MRKGDPISDVDSYLSKVTPEARATLEKLRKTIKAAVPKAVEVISYDIPTFKLDGRMLVSYAAFKNHCSFFPGAAPIKEHEDELKSYVTSKGTIRFPTGKPLPAALVKKLVKTRITENEARAKK
ncbi:MAG: iron chaperone [Pyrinomonadaceae bacterium]